MRLLYVMLLLFSSAVFATDEASANPPSPPGCGPSYWNPERDRFECVIIPAPPPQVVIREAYPVYVPRPPTYVAPAPIFYDPVPAILGAAIVGGIVHHSLHHQRGHVQVPPPMYRPPRQTVYLRDNYHGFHSGHRHGVHPHQYGGGIHQQYRR